MEVAFSASTPTACFLFASFVNGCEGMREYSVKGDYRRIECKGVVEGLDELRA